MIARPSNVQALTKADRTPVTTADFAVQSAVTGLFETSFPDEALVAEEDSRRLRESTGRWIGEVVGAVRRIHPDSTEEQILNWLDRGVGSPRARYWALDPVDGTKGLLRGGQFAAALALVEDGAPVLGALACPRYARFGEMGCLALAVRGQGAWAAPLHGGEWTRLEVSAIEDPRQSRLLRSVESGLATHRMLGRIRGELGTKAADVRMDSQVKYLALAAAEGDLHVRLPRRTGRRENTWDHAAGVLLVEEAGGQTSDLAGQPLDFGAGRQLVRNLGIVASNARLHTAALAALRRVAPDGWAEVVPPTGLPSGGSDS
jgi:3'(2'), 5'-bisphosphate nucleotidase